MTPSDQNTEVPPANHAEQPTAPAQSTQGINTQPPALPLKKSKPGLLVGLISVGVLVLGLATAGVVYAFVYNSPENVVTDSIMKTLSATNGELKGSMTIKSGGMDIKYEFTSASNDANQESAEQKVTMTVAGKSTTMKMQSAMTKDAFYIKLDDVRGFMKSIFGEENAELNTVIEENYGKILNKVDGKWVVVKMSEFEEMTGGSINAKDMTCVQDQLNKLGKDSALQNELMDAYKKNPLFNITSQGSDNYGNRYSLKPVGKERTKSFVNAMTETRFFKLVNDCTDGALKKAANSPSTTSGSDVSNASLDVWVDGWSHNLNKVAFSMSDKDLNISGEILPKINTKPKVVIPEGQTSVNDIKTDLEDIFSNYQDTYESSFDVQDSIY